MILLVTGRISGELAFKAARARISVVATPSIPSSIAVDIANAARMTLIGRAVSGKPQIHGRWDSGIGNRESGIEQADPSLRSGQAGNGEPGAL